MSDNFVSPPDWGDDELTKFWDTARANQFATFVRKRPIFNRMVKIDQQFIEISKRWTNPKHELAALLFLRCHSALRSAMGNASAGQAAESYVMCRSALEFAAYALHISRNPALGAVWLNRHNDPNSLEAAVRAFSHRKVSATVVAVNKHAGDRFEELYQRTIDFGGHPNERSVTSNMSILKGPGQRTMLTIFLHEDGPALDAALKNTAQCGLCALEILQGVFNALFELLGVNAQMLELRKGL